MVTPLVVGLLAAVGGGIHLAARANVRRIKQNPDPYPLALLGEEPHGQEVYIPRPDGTRLRTIVRDGTGPTIVLAHGYGAAVLEWNVIWTMLSAANYRLITFDHRGHGQSTVGEDGINSAAMAGDINAVLEHFDVTDGVLVGHSMGGFLSIIFMLTYPQVAAQRLRHCVIMASFAGDVYRGAPQTRLQIPLITSGIMQRLLKTETYGWWFSGSLAGDCPAPSAVEVFRQLFDQVDHRQLVPILQALAAENYYDRLGEITVPCTIVYGLRDKTTPAIHSETMHQRIRGSQIVRIAKVGHMLNWEAPDAVVAAIHAAAQPLPTAMMTPPPMTQQPVIV